MTNTLAKMMLALVLAAMPLRGGEFSTQRPSDESVASAVGFLLELQSPDGTWQSEVYGPFKGGDALTAHVALTLVEVGYIPDQLLREQARKSLSKARDYLTLLVADDGSVHGPSHGLAYPLYTAAGAAIVLSSSHDVQHLQARDRWIDYLRQRQLTEALEWTDDDPEYGGWGYAAQGPRKTSDGAPLGDLAKPNLSATVFALRALHAAGVPSTDPAIRKARHFVEHCQNFAPTSEKSDAAFDDGGFVFVLDDPVRNKAGSAGIDRHGRARFTSYGSATADGLNALMLCGAEQTDPRVEVAWRWLETHFDADRHPGKYAPDRQGAQQSVYYYYCFSLANLLSDYGSAHSAEQARSQRMASKLLAALAARQQADGAWRNAAVDVREDDPLVATPLAVVAEMRCVQLLLQCPAAPKL